MNKRFKALVLSIFIWGGGQFFVCKQKIKGLLFFLLELLVIGVELGSGYWLEYFTGQINHFTLRLHGGYFTRGIWGLITLGEVPGAKGGDHSTVLLINGVIAVLLLIIILFLYLWNLKDAYDTGNLIDKTGECPSSKEYFKEFYKKSFEHIVLTPVLLLIIFIVFMPILFSFLTAFTNYNRNHLPPASLISWVGFENFTKLFKVPIWSSTFLKVFIWTVIWTICATFSTYFFGMFQAIMLNSKYTKCKTLFRTILILPWAIPQMITLLVFKNLLNNQFGPINQLLINWGIISERIPFLTDPTIAKITVIVVNLWMGFPMFMVMILGVLSNIDLNLYEAAAIDGASESKVFRSITLPLVFRATAPLLIMNLAGNFNGFGSIFFLTDGGPANSNLQFAGDTDILISWIYKMTLNHQMYDMAAVMSIILFILIGSVSFWNFKRTQAFKEA